MSDWVDGVRERAVSSPEWHDLQAQLAAEVDRLLREQGVRYFSDLKIDERRNLVSAALTALRKRAAPVVAAARQAVATHTDFGLFEQLRARETAHAQQPAGQAAAGGAPATATATATAAASASSAAATAASATTTETRSELLSELLSAAVARTLARLSDTAAVELRAILGQVMSPALRAAAWPVLLRHPRARSEADRMLAMMGGASGSRTGTASSAVSMRRDMIHVAQAALASASGTLDQKQFTAMLELVRLCIDFVDTTWSSLGQMQEADVSVCCHIVSVLRALEPAVVIECAVCALERVHEMRWRTPEQSLAFERAVSDALGTADQPLLDHLQTVFTGSSGPMGSPLRGLAPLVRAWVEQWACNVWRADAASFAIDTLLLGGERALARLVAAAIMCVRDALLKARSTDAVDRVFKSQSRSVDAYALQHVFSTAFVDVIRAEDGHAPLESLQFVRLQELDHGPAFAFPARSFADRLVATRRLHEPPLWMPPSVPAVDASAAALSVAGSVSGARGGAAAARSAVGSAAGASGGVFVPLPSGGELELVGASLVPGDTLLELCIRMLHETAAAASQRADGVVSVAEQLCQPTSATRRALLAAARDFVQERGARLADDSERQVILLASRPRPVLVVAPTARDDALRVVTRAYERAGVAVPPDVAEIALRVSAEASASAARSAVQSGNGAFKVVSSGGSAAQPQPPASVTWDPSIADSSGTREPRTMLSGTSNAVPLAGLRRTELFPQGSDSSAVGSVGLAGRPPAVSPPPASQALSSPPPLSTPGSPHSFPEQPASHLVATDDEDGYAVAAVERMALAFASVVWPADDEAAAYEERVAALQARLRAQVAGKP